MPTCNVADISRLHSTDELTRQSTNGAATTCLRTVQQSFCVNDLLGRFPNQHGLKILTFSGVEWSILPFSLVLFASGHHIVLLHIDHSNLEIRSEGLQCKNSTYIYYSNIKSCMSMHHCEYAAISKSIVRTSSQLVDTR